MCTRYFEIDLLETAAGKVGAADSAAHTLFTSVQKLKTFPEFMQVWPAHGDGSACGKALGAVPSSTIGYERRFNPALLAASSEDTFVNFILDGQPEPPLYFARMKKENKEGPRILGSLPEPRMISAIELKKLDLRKVVIVDTRPWNDFREAHIAWSFSHPLNKSFPTDIGALVGDDPEIYFICEEYELSDLVRNCVRIGLDRIVGWAPATAVEEFKEIGGKVLTTLQKTVSEVKEGIVSGKLNVLDVRRLTEYKEGHIHGALNIVHTRLASQLAIVPKDKPLVVHCRSGVRSSYACGLLERAGFNIINLEGGMLAWEKSGAPREK